MLSDLATALHGPGLGQGDRVAVLPETRPEPVRWSFAGFLAGRAD